MLWQLYPLLAAQLSDMGLNRLYAEVELPLVDVLISMEEEGVRIDVDALKDYSRRLSEERDGIEKSIFELAGGQFNISSPKQLGEVLYERLKITDKLKNFLIEKGYDPKNGARPLRRAIEDYLESELSEAIIGEEVKKGEIIEAKLSKDNKIKITVEKKEK